MQRPVLGDSDPTQAGLERIPSIKNMLACHENYGFKEDDLVLS